MKYLLLSFLFLLPFSTAHALTPVYCHVVQADIGVVDPGEAIGEPDGVAVQIIDQGDSVTLGFPHESTERLHKAVIYDFPAPNIVDRPWIKIELMNVGDVVAETLQRIDSTQSDNLTGPTNPDPYDRVRFTLISGDPLLIDAVWFEEDEEIVEDVEIVEVVEPEPEPEPDPEPVVIDEPEVSSSITHVVPRLVKLFNDGDPATQYDTTVYVIDSEEKRRPFSHEVIYFTWFTDFSLVEEISLEEMASHTVGAPMPMHYGTWLIKIQSMNDVYAVSQTNVLHLIPDEAIAIELYGEDWSTRVRDVFPTDWPHYEVGEPITGPYPEDTLIRDGNLVTWILRDGQRYWVPEDDLEYHGIQAVHRIYKPFLDLSGYPIADLYGREDNVGWFNI